ALLPARASAQPLSAAADEVKAAYLYRFIGYVEWPASALPAPGRPLVIGVVGADAVEVELSRVLVGRTALGRPLVARKVAPGNPTDDLQVLFVGDVDLARSAWVQRLRDRPILIVTDAPQGLDAGGALNFVLIQGHLRFEASRYAVDRAGLKVSSRLLALARRVVDAP
ncbi:MAG: YfiR family protein, partial [Caldimonas sp.]